MRIDKDTTMANKLRRQTMDEWPGPVDVLMFSSGSAGLH